MVADWLHLLLTQKGAFAYEEKGFVSVCREIAGRKGQDS